MEALVAALVAASFVAGLTGTWSPCGFSMIETLGPSGHSGGRPTTLAACATFTLGALVGGVVTFGTLAALGGLVHGADDRAAYLVAAAIAVVAAAWELRGAPIVPQLRRQLPEHWRRLMPMPIAGGLYGVLLGLGFTTFVLTVGVWALAAVAFAVGDPGAGLAIGLAFGAGRALPIAFTAPLRNRSLGIRVTETMAERPVIYRRFRLGDGAALVAVAAALVVTVPANAATVERSPAADPSVSDAGTAFQRPDRSGILVRRGNELNMGGHHPALGGRYAAVVRGGGIALLAASDLSELKHFAAAGTDAVAVSGDLLAWRQRSDGRDVIRVRSIGASGTLGTVRTIAGAGGKAQLGRPSVDGSQLVYAKATPRANKIIRVRGGKKRAILRSRTVGISNPSIGGKKLLYVRHERKYDRLILVSLKGKKSPKLMSGRKLVRKRNGTLWSTALSKGRAYVTHIKGSTPSQKVLSAKR